MAVNDTTTLDTVREAAGGRFERARLFLSEVRNELVVSFVASEPFGSRA